MPNCPSCGTKVLSPSRMFSVIVEPSPNEHGMTERKVGMYQCPKCETKFPTVISRQHYLIVAEDQLKEIHTSIKSLKKDNEDLQKKVQEMDKEYGDLQKTLLATKKEAETKQLEEKLLAIEEQVAYLRKEKGELEGKISKFR